MPTIRPMQAGDIPALAGVLARAYDSEQTYDWRLRSYLQLRKVKTFVADLDGEAVGMVIGNDYGPVAYVSQMAVDPPLHRQRIGLKLMDALIAWADAHGFVAIELDATPAGAPLYQRYDFIDADRTDIFESRGSDARPSSARSYTPGDRTAIFRADALALGADRAEVLGFLIDSAPQSVLVAETRGRVDGYAIAQRRPQLLGPVIAATPRLAAELIDAAYAALRPEHRISVPSANSAIAQILQERGYRLLRSLRHMVRGARPPADRNRLFARINLGQG